MWKLTLGYKNNMHPVDGVLVGASSLWPKSLSPRLDPILTGPKWEVNCQITLSFSFIFKSIYLRSGSTDK